MCNFDNLDEVQAEIDYYVELIKAEEITFKRMRGKLKQLQDRELYLIANGAVPQSLDGE